MDENFLANPDAREALHILGESNRHIDWVGLYKVYEIVRENIRPRDLVGESLLTSAERTAFTGSANRPDVSGPLARHARMGGKPPTRTMALVDARQLITRMVADWLDAIS